MRTSSLLYDSLLSNGGINFQGYNEIHKIHLNIPTNIVSIQSIVLLSCVSRCNLYTGDD